MREEERADEARPETAGDGARIVRFLIGKALLFLLFPAVLAALAVFFMI